MPSTLTPRQRLLASALTAAKNAAVAAKTDDDGGSANLDSPFLYFSGLRADAVRLAAEAAGVSVSRHRTRWWNGWFVHVAEGQGANRTRMAEAAVDALRVAGEEAAVYYQTD